MLILAPVLLLLFAALLIFVLQQVRPGFGLTWLISGLLTLGVWGLLIYFHFNPLPPFTITGWRPVEGEGAALLFLLDDVSWPYAFSLVGLLVAVIFTAATRFQTGTSPWSWLGSILITAAGLLAVMAGNPLTLVLAWTMVDMIELGVMLRSSTQPIQAQQSVLAFSARVAGTFLAIWALLMNQAAGSAMTLESITDESGLVLLLAAGLRLGVVPLYLPFTNEVRMRRGLGTVLRLAAPATALTVLSRLPAWVAPPNWALAMLVFTALAAFYGSAMWAAAKDELSARPYWLISLAGMAVACAVRGRPQAAIPWGVVLLLSGGIIYLQAIRDRRIIFLPMMGFFALTGLPFTPAASGWQGLVVLPFTLLDVVFLFSHVLLLVGYARHMLGQSARLTDMERWVQALYPFGLLVLVASLWFLGLRGWQGSLTVGTWWASALSTVLALLALGGIAFLRRSGVQMEGRLNWILALANRIGGGLSGILRLDWFYRFLWAVYGVLQGLIQFFITLLEGEGGLLWALLLLALFVTILRPGGAL
jgi:hypothetical protein